MCSRTEFIEGEFASNRVRVSIFVDMLDTMEKVMLFHRLCRKVKTKLLNNIKYVKKGSLTNQRKQVSVYCGIVCRVSTLLRVVCLRYCVV